MRSSEQEAHKYKLAEGRKMAEGLGSANKVPRGTGRKSKRKSTDDVPAAKTEMVQTTNM